MPGKTVPCFVMEHWVAKDRWLEALLKLAQVLVTEARESFSERASQWKEQFNEHVMLTNLAMQNGSFMMSLDV